MDWLIQATFSQEQPTEAFYSVNQQQSDIPATIQWMISSFMDEDFERCLYARKEIYPKVMVVGWNLKKKSQSLKVAVSHFV